MAAIQSLRKNTWILTVVIGLAMLAFIFTGLDNSLFSSKQSNTIAEINGKEYAYDEYQSIYDMLDNQQKASGQELSYAQREQISTNAWTSFLTGKLFEECYTNLGLSTFKENLKVYGISDEEIEDITVGENIDPELQYYFTNPQTGAFDKNMLINVLSNLSAAKENNPEFYTNWIQFEKALHENTLRRKYVSLVSNGIYYTKLEAENSAQTKNNQFDINYIRIPYESIADSTIAVNDKELETFYKTISHEKRFEQEAGVTLEYITYDIVPTAEDIKAIEESVVAKAEGFKNNKNDAVFLNLNSDEKFNPTYNKKGSLAASLDSFAFNGNLGDITPIYFENNSFKIAKISDIRMGADSAKVRHILVDGENALRTIDSLKSLIENGADFAALARQYSKDSASGINGGIIDWFKEGEMVPSFQDSSFFGEKGKLYVAPSTYGVHLIQILEQGPKSKKVQVQTLSKAITYSQATRSHVYQNAVKFVSENRTKEAFEAATENNKSLVLKYANNTQEDQRVIPGIDDSRQVIRWAHQNKEKVGEVSEIFRCGDKFLIAVIASVEEEGIAKLDQVKDIVTEEYRKEQKKKQILDELKNVKYTTLESLSQAKALNIQSSTNLSFATMSGLGIGVEPVLFATLSTMGEKAISNPIAGERGVYVAQITAKKVADITTPEKEIVGQRQRNASSITNNIYKILEDKAEIEDNRLNFN